MASPRANSASSPRARRAIDDLDGARSCLPDQDLEPSARLDVRRELQLGPVAEERRARERVHERPLDDASARDDWDPIAKFRLCRGNREKRRKLYVGAPNARGAPRKEYVSRGLAKHVTEPRDPLFVARQRRELAAESVGCRAVLLC